MKIIIEKSKWYRGRYRVFEMRMFSKMLDSVDLNNPIEEEYIDDNGKVCKSLCFYPEVNK